MSDGMSPMGGAPGTTSPGSAPSPQPGASPAAPPGAAPGGAPPPTGPTGATMPVANQGLQMKAMSKLAELAQGIQMILAVLPVGSDVSKDISEALNKMRKHLSPGAEQGGPAVTEKQLGLMQQRQSGGQQVAGLRGGPPGAPPGAAPPAAA